MKWPQEKIDRAIVETFHRLYSVEQWRAVGDGIVPQKIATMLPDFMWCLHGKEARGFLPAYQGPYEAHLDLCKELAASCDDAQKCAIWNIVVKTVKIRLEMCEELLNKKREASVFEFKFDVDDEYGRMFIAFKTAFEMPDTLFANDR